VNLRIALVRLAGMFRRSRLERELDQDIQEHLQMATEDNLRRGMSPREAAEAARRAFGGMEQMKEEFRDQRGIPVLETLSREARIAFRSLRKAPGFAVLSILTLALAIGANSAIFSAVNALLFNPAGITEPNRVVVVRARYDKLGLGNLVISLSDFEQVSGSPQIFSCAAIAKAASFTYTAARTRSVSPHCACPGDGLRSSDRSRRKVGFSPRKRISPATTGLSCSAMRLGIASSEVTHRSWVESLSSTKALTK